MTGLGRGRHPSPPRRAHHQASPPRTHEGLNEEKKPGETTPRCKVSLIPSITPPPAQLRQSTGRSLQVRAGPTDRHARSAACRSPGPASYDSPSDPVLRANPCPEVTDPICRLPLPTLFYRLEAVHLGDLLRISVRPGTRVKSTPQDFQGPTGVHRTPREARCFTAPRSLSRGDPIPGTLAP